MIIARPKLQEVLSETKSMLETSRSRLIHPLVANDIDTLDLDRYSITIETDKPYKLGDAISVRWTAPENHSARDWIGVYKITANKDRHITNISSRGLWDWVVPISAGGDTKVVTEGTLVFKGCKLPWQTGTYEFRYHHDGKHSVMTRSVPFEITAPERPALQDKEAVQRCLLKLIQHVLGNDSERMPVTPVDEYIGMGEKEAKHVAYTIKLMFGVEFAWEIILADKCAARLTKRLYHALDALAPFAVEKPSLSTSPSSTVSSTPSSPSLTSAASFCSPSMMAKVATTD